MKYFFNVVAVSLLFSIASCDKNTGVSNVKLATPGDSISYTLGMTIGEQLNGMAADIDMSDVDYKMLLQGIKDQRDSIAIIELEDAGKFLDVEFQKRYNAKVEGKNKPDAEKYIAEKKAVPGIQATASGLLYQIISMGTGLTAVLGDTIVAHYVGTKIDGTTFDSTEGKEPAEFPIAPGMIAGWNEGVTLLPEGSKFILYIPWELAYGKDGSRSIAPYSALTFNMEILKVKKAKL